MDRNVNVRVRYKIKTRSEECPRTAEVRSVTAAVRSATMVEVRMAKIEGNT